MKSGKVAFYTLGCKVNQYETDSIRNQLIKIGYEEVSFEEKADIYIVNSCTVTGIADKKSRNMLRRAKNANPDGIVIATGCYAQTNAKELSEMKEIDYIVGNSDKRNIVEFITGINKNKNKEKVLNDNIFLIKDYEEYDFSSLREMSRAYIKIQDGCNNFCSYCKIPFARGKSRSRLPENIYKEVERIGDEGFKEIIIIGVNLGAYGEDIPGNITLEDVIEKIEKIPTIERIRIGSVYPDKINERFVNIFKSNKVMPHLHISLQSCDDDVLKSMRRDYDSKLIEEKLFMLREKVDNIEFTGDVIVGFPGETDKMFQNSYDIIKKIGFSGLHIFPYSDRENTLAEKMKNKVPNNVKKDREKRLEELFHEMAISERKKYIGKELKVLIEEKLKDGYCYGYSENYLRVKTIQDKSLINKIIKIKINSLGKEMLLTDGK